MRNGHYTFASPASQTLCERGYSLATRIASLTPLQRVSQSYQEQNQQVRADLELQLLEANIALLEEHRTLAGAGQDQTRFDTTLAQLRDQYVLAGGQLLENVA